MKHEELISTLAQFNKAEVDELLAEVSARKKKLAGDAHTAVVAGDVDALLIAVEAGADMSGHYAPGSIVHAAETAVAQEEVRMLNTLLDIARSRFARNYPTVLVNSVYHAVKSGKVEAYDAIRYHISAHNAYDAWETGTNVFHTSYTYHLSINGRLELAAEQGHEAMVDRLIQEWPALAEYDYPYRLLSAAVKSGNPAILKKVLDAGLPDKDEAYVGAAIDGLKAGNVTFLTLLMEAGLDLDAPSKISRSIRGMWADDKPLLSVRWVLQYEAMQADHYNGEIAEVLRAPEAAHESS